MPSFNPKEKRRKWRRNTDRKRCGFYEEKHRVNTCVPSWARSCCLITACVGARWAVGVVFEAGFCASTSRPPGVSFILPACC